jgi:hypothetical protein
LFEKAEKLKLHILEIPPFLVCLQKKEPAYMFNTVALPDFWRMSLHSLITGETMLFDVKTVSCRIWQYVMAI